MSALGRVVRSGVGRRRVQTGVIALVVAIAVTAAVLGGSLMVASNAPFDRAFAQQNGAHLTARFDASKTTAAQLKASANVTGVTATAGPFATATITPTTENGRILRAMTVAGRADPGGTVDAVTLLQGRWVTKPGELVLHSDGRLPEGVQPKVGDVLELKDLPGSPTLTVVGIARSVSQTAAGWVDPRQVGGLLQAGDAGGYQLLYRLAAADTEQQVEAVRTAVAASVPAKALTGAQSWLATRLDSVGNTVLLVPFLLAFGVLGLFMAVFIIGNVIAGAVGTGTRRIGILKALGFTPHQVVRAYVGQALIPASVGAGLGVVVGNLLTVPVLAQTNQIYGTSDSGVAPWVDALVLAGALALVLVTAWTAAARAGRLRTVDVLAVGRTPRPGRGQWAARLSARLRLPRAVTLGLAQPFARPVRSATIIAAIAFGAAAATFAVGLGTSLNRVQATESHGDVVIYPAPSTSGPATAPPPGGGPRIAPGGPPPAPDQAAVVKAITAQAGTSGYTGVAETNVTVAGIAEPVDTLALTGANYTSYGFEILEGSWFDGPGEIVVAKPFLTATGTKVGDTLTLTSEGTRFSVRIVGEAFNIQSQGMQLLMDLGTLAKAQPDLRAQTYTITLDPGTSTAEYVTSLNAALGDVARAEVTEEEVAEVVLVINGLTVLLTLLLVVVAALGVLNLVVLETRERVHDLGVHKALGMTPRQTIAMVIASVVVTGLVGGAVGAPIGVLMQKLVVGEMGRVTGFDLPASVTDVYQPLLLVLFGLGGLAIALLGALLPAGWAAGTRTATALRTE